MFLVNADASEILAGSVSIPTMRVECLNKVGKIAPAPQPTSTQMTEIGAAKRTMFSEAFLSIDAMKEFFRLLCHVAA